MKAALFTQHGGPEANAADNLINLEVMIARQVFLPLVNKALPDLTG